MKKHLTFENVVMSVLFVLVVLVFVAAIFSATTSQQNDGQVIEFDGHRLQADGNSTVKIESNYQTQVWSDSDPLTVTTSIVTVTIWTKGKP